MRTWIMLSARQGKGAQIMHLLELKARKNPKRVVFGEGREPKVIRAAHEVDVHGIAHPILLGHVDEIRKQIADLGLDWAPEIIDPIDTAEA